MLKNEAEKENKQLYRNTPGINEISKKLLEEKEKKNEGPAHVRLNKQKLKKDEKQETIKAKPKHSETEMMEHTNYLYKDFEKQKERRQELHKKYDEIKEKNMVTLKSISKKFVLRNFVKQFKAQIANIMEDKKENKTEGTCQLNLFELSK